MSEIWDSFLVVTLMIPIIGFAMPVLAIINLYRSPFRERFLEYVAESTVDRFAVDPAADDTAKFYAWLHRLSDRHGQVSTDDEVERLADFAPNHLREIEAIASQIPEQVSREIKWISSGKYSPTFRFFIYQLRFRCWLGSARLTWHAAVRAAPVTWKASVDELAKSRPAVAYALLLGAAVLAIPSFFFADMRPSEFFSQSAVIQGVAVTASAPTVNFIRRQEERHGQSVRNRLAGFAAFAVFATASTWVVRQDMKPATFTVPAGLRQLEALALALTLGLSVLWGAVNFGRRARATWPPDVDQLIHWLGGASVLVMLSPVVWLMAQTFPDAEPKDVHIGNWVIWALLGGFVGLSLASLAISTREAILARKIRSAMPHGKPNRIRPGTLGWLLLAGWYVGGIGLVLSASQLDAVEGIVGIPPTVLEVVAIIALAAWILGLPVIPLVLIGFWFWHRRQVKYDLNAMRQPPPPQPLL